jgi:hypothetical protein
MSLELKGDVIKGDPAVHIIGKPEEQSARFHRPLTKKKPPITAKTILADIKLRRQQLEPAIEEYNKLKRADEALKGI